MGNNKRERRQRAQLARAAGLPPPPRARMPSPPIAEAGTPTEALSTASSGSPDLLATVPVTDSTQLADLEGIEVPWPYTILHERLVLAIGCFRRGEIAEARERFEALYEEAKHYYGVANRITTAIGERLIRIYAKQDDREALLRLMVSKMDELFPDL